MTNQEVHVDGDGAAARSYFQLVSSSHGQANRESLIFRDPSFYEQQHINLVLGEAVEHLSMTDAGAGFARTASGHRFPFDRLALATGARPRTLRIPGADLRGVLMLRGLDDAERLRNRLLEQPDVVVIGGGFVGLEVAGTARKLGCNVTVVEAGPALMGRAVSAATAEFVRAAHTAAGVRIVTGALPDRLVDDECGRVRSVQLADGPALPANLVVVGVGVQPADELARAAGLDCANGILVDAFSLASDGCTLAVGDCANLPDPSPVTGSHPRLRLESVDNAVEQARAAATTVLGDPRPYRGIPWFWSDQVGAKLQIAGLADACDAVVVRTSDKPGRQTVLRFRHERLVAAECVNAPADFLTVRKALVAGRAIDRQTVTRPAKLKDLLAQPGDLHRDTEHAVTAMSPVRSSPGQVGEHDRLEVPPGHHVPVAAVGDGRPPVCQAEHDTRPVLAASATGDSGTKSRRWAQCSPASCRQAPSRC